MYSQPALFDEICYVFILDLVWIWSCVLFCKKVNCLFINSKTCHLAGFP